MIIENTPLTYLVEFTSGTPSGVFSYSLTDEDGNDIILNEEITPTNGAVSVSITIPSSANQIDKPLFETRFLNWSYPTTNGVITGNYTYQIQKKVPFPCSYDGVRRKLGITDEDIPDSQIDLLTSYVEFDELFDGGLDIYASLGNSTTLKIANAIEALAALKILPTLQLSIAKRYTSGTNEYERWTKIDWDILAGALSQIVYDVTVLIDPNQAYTLDTLFTLGVRSPDPLTGA